MAIVLGQLVNRAQRRLQACDHVLGGDPAEFARTRHCQQVKANIGRRRAVRQRRLGIYLQIVGGQIVVQWGDAVFKKAPRVLRNVSQVSALVSCQPQVFRSACRQAGPPGKDGAKCPQRKQRSAIKWVRAVEQSEHTQRQTGQRCVGLLAYKRAQGVFGGCLGGGGGCPLQQVLAANAHAPQRSDYRVKQQACLVKQLGKLPHRCAKRQPQRSHTDVKEMAQHNAAPTGYQACKCAQQRPRQKGRQHHGNCF